MNWPYSGQPIERASASVRAAELDGLAFAFRARTLAIAVVLAWIVWLVPWPRDLYYAAFAAAFFVSGFIPYRLRHRKYALGIKLLFVVVDVVLITAAILVPPPVGPGPDWPVQTRLRGQEFLYLGLLLAEAALTYSPWTVVWTGTTIMACWSAAVLAIFARPNTVTYAQAVMGSTDPEARMRVVFDPFFVGVTPLTTQIVATGLSTLLLALAVWRSRRSVIAQVETELVRSDLARYVSPDIVEALTAAPAQGFGEPSTRTVAVLYADIVGFTTVAERLSPERTFALLRTFRERSCDVVFRHGGTLDKFLGDGFMAIFGALETQPDAAGRALACAFDLGEAIARWNAERRADGGFTIVLSVGLHCGPVMAGNLGSRTRSEFTVVGDVVNVASRLEEATRTLGAAIVASDDCVAAGDTSWRSRFTRSEELHLRGRETPLRVHIAVPPQRVVSSRLDRRD